MVVVEAFLMSAFMSVFRVCAPGGIGIGSGVGVGVGGGFLGGGAGASPLSPRFGVAPAGDIAALG